MVALRCTILVFTSSLDQCGWHNAECSSLPSASMRNIATHNWPIKKHCLAAISVSFFSIHVWELSTVVKSVSSTSMAFNQFNECIQYRVSISTVSWSHTLLRVSKFLLYTWADSHSMHVYQMGHLASSKSISMQWNAPCCWLWSRDSDTAQEFYKHCDCLKKIHVLNHQ